MAVPSGAVAATDPLPGGNLPLGNRQVAAACSSPDANGGSDASSRVRHESRRAGLADALSDRATSALIRRTLCPQQRATDKARDADELLLPPLTSRNDVDFQLYALLAIVLREFVQSWYGRITADESLVQETVPIVAHCTTALEQRVRMVDLQDLFLDEVPDLLEKHIIAYRAAHQPVSPPPLLVDPREVYHALCPLPFLSPVPRDDETVTVSEQLENERSYRQLLVQAVLAVLLPTEDLENPCLNALAGQILSELVIGNAIANRATQPWLLLEGICILARDLEESRAQAAERIARSSHPLPEVTLHAKAPRRWTLHAFFLWLVQSTMFLVGMGRLCLAAIAMSSSLPRRTSPADSQSGTSTAHRDASPEVQTPVLALGIWSCMGALVEMPARMPWLHGWLSLLQHGAIHGPGKLARLNGRLDRLLSHHIRAPLFNPTHLAPLLRSLRGVLFPLNAPGSPTLFPPSSDLELRALRRRAASALLRLLPSGLARLYFGGGLWAGDPDEADEKALDEVESLLMVFSDEYCNKHLMYSVLELILARLMPELRHKGVEELLDDRLG